MQKIPYPVGMILRVLPNEDEEQAAEKFVLVVEVTKAGTPVVVPVDRAGLKKNPGYPKNMSWSSITGWRVYGCNTEIFN